MKSQNQGPAMKSRTQVRKKLSSLRTLLDRAEDNYTQAIGLRDEGSWKRRCRQLEAQIEMLLWVLGDDEKKPSTEHVDGLLKPKDSGLIPEQQREQEDYGALCNPKRHGE